LYRSSLPAGDREALKPFFLLTDKPTMAVINVGEDELADTHEIVPAVEKQVGAGVDVLAVSVQLEAETARLDPAERVELLEGLGLARALWYESRRRRSTFSGSGYSSPPAKTSLGLGSFAAARKPLSALEQSTPTFSEASSKLT